ncbi:hypothetical protein PENSPDRAFT_688206 [Peniophora sp. CONT]|nr:hypothetical protein PENSPDRAFT_688206 [Peniophora sp. CONT]
MRCDRNPRVQNPVCAARKNGDLLHKCPVKVHAKESKEAVTTEPETKPSVAARLAAVRAKATQDNSTPKLPFELPTGSRNSDVRPLISYDDAYTEAKSGLKSTSQTGKYQSVKGTKGKGKKPAQAAKPSKPSASRAASATQTRAPKGKEKEKDDRSFSVGTVVFIPYGLRCVRKFSPNSQAMLSFTATVLPSVLSGEFPREDAPADQIVHARAPQFGELSRLEGENLVVRGRADEGGLITFNADLGDDEGKIEGFVLVDLFGLAGITNLVGALPAPRNHWHPIARAREDRDSELDSTLDFVVLSKEGTKLVTAGSIKNKITIDILRSAATPSGRKNVNQTLYLGARRRLPTLCEDSKGSEESSEEESQESDDERAHSPPVRLPRGRSTAKAAFSSDASPTLDSPRNSEDEGGQHDDDEAMPQDSAALAQPEFEQSHHDSYRDEEMESSGAEDDYISLGREKRPRRSSPSGTQGDTEPEDADDVKRPRAGFAGRGGRHAHDVSDSEEDILLAHMHHRSLQKAEGSMSMMSMNDVRDVERELSGDIHEGSPLNSDEEKRLGQFERRAHKMKQNAAVFRALGANESDSED